MAATSSTIAMRRRAPPESCCPTFGYIHDPGGASSSKMRLGFPPSTRRFLQRARSSGHAAYPRRDVALVRGPTRTRGRPFEGAFAKRRLVQRFFEEVPCSPCGVMNAWDVANDGATQ